MDTDPHASNSTSDGASVPLTLEFMMISGMVLQHRLSGGWLGDKPSCVQTLCSGITSGGTSGGIHMPLNQS